MFIAVVYLDETVMDLMTESEPLLEAIASTPILYVFCEANSFLKI